MPEKANSDKSEDREKQNVDVLPPESKDKDMEEISGLLPSWREKTADTDLVHVTPLQKYLAEIRRHPLLTREQERELAVRYHDEGEVSAAYRLVVSNLRLVVKIAMDYRRAFVNVLDLIQEGNIGLMQAVSKYDPYKDVKLSSYAAWWIKAYILRYILNNWRLVKMGTTQAQRKLFYNLQKEKDRLATMGIEPSPALIAKRLDVPTREVIEMEKRMDKPEVSLEAPISHDGSGTVSDLIPSGDSRPDDIIERIDQAEQVQGLLEEFALTLNEKDSYIFRNRMLAEDPMTLQEIGDVYGISRERVRQIEKKLMNRLKEFMIQEGFEY